MTFYVYTYRDQKGIFYVGKGKGKRAFDHLNPTYKSRVAAKVRNMNETPIVDIWNVDSETKALELEVKLISLLGRKDLGTGRLMNLTNGGDGASGICRSEETKRKNSIANTGRIFSEEHRANISKSRTGKKHSQDTLLKMSLSKKGKAQCGTGMLGKKHSPETRAKMRAKRLEYVQR